MKYFNKNMIYFLAFSKTFFKSLYNSWSSLKVLSMKLRVKSISAKSFKTFNSCSVNLVIKILYVYIGKYVDRLAQKVETFGLVAFFNKTTNLKFN